MGRAVVVAMPVLVTAVPPTTIALVGAGGVLYTVGAIAGADALPEPVPARVFGYHEVWHTMVVAAAVLHYAAIRGLVSA